MGLSLFHGDAFPTQPFTCNPSAVCVRDEPGDPAWMQEVAREMNLAETAFLHQQTDGYGLRWFTPLVEVDLSGEEQARFYTKSGLLTADVKADAITRRLD